ncbi:MAG: single-stranded DNA-binding protein, partial [Dolichospermum sp.]
HQGDRVIIEGRLGMNTIDRPEGFKEKRAELTVQKIHAIGQGTYTSSPAAVTPVAQPTYSPTNYESNYPPSTPAEKNEPQVTATQRTYQPTPVQTASPVGVTAEPDPDDIPF